MRSRQSKVPLSSKVSSPERFIPVPRESPDTSMQLSSTTMIPMKLTSSRMRFKDTPMLPLRLSLENLHSLVPQVTMLRPSLMSNLLSLSNTSGNNTTNLRKL